MDSIANTTTVNLANKLQSSQELRTEADDQATEVAKQFEALLLYTMMKSMRASLSEDTLTGSDQQDMYREMMDREIAESISKGGGLGIQQMLERQLTVTSANDTAADDKLAPKSLNDLERAGQNTSVSLDFLTRQRLLATSPSE